MREGQELKTAQLDQSIPDNLKKKRKIVLSIKTARDVPSTSIKLPRKRKLVLHSSNLKKTAIVNPPSPSFIEVGNILPSTTVPTFSSFRHYAQYYPKKLTAP